MTGAISGGGRRPARKRASSDPTKNANATRIQKARHPARIARPRQDACDHIPVVTRPHSRKAVPVADTAPHPFEQKDIGFQIVDYLDFAVKNVR